MNKNDLRHQINSPFNILLLAVVAEGYADFLNSLSTNAVNLRTFYP